MTEEKSDTWFPGPVIGGLALIVGPVVWLTGMLLRYLASHSVTLTPEQERVAGDTFAAGGQLAAYNHDPTFVTASYAMFVAGALLLWPAICTLAQITATRSPHLARWGGILIIMGLFARLYYAGVDQSAFELARTQDWEHTTRTVLDRYVGLSYGPWRIPVTAAFCHYVGVLLMTIAAFRSRTFGLVRSLLFLAAGVVFMGVLKESTVLDVVVSSGLCLVLVPLGVRTLRRNVPAPLADARPPVKRGAARILSW
ncbi:hypothetical protein [Actinomadura decatromicini]|uniref:Uncharacterized protein n=1 Tax=Actinomadura decatromicini TaxID=2604572 RepID=A0A5D3FZ54_9ACTN|nr:hypothetical protein [Actinomadura decatromicini]TYK53288.1 hypothetical protein FXF68_06130 [Actinomadura decatromicini]